MNIRLIAFVVLAFTLSACEQYKYDPSADAAKEFESALSDATSDDKYLMVVFGADWCPDCLKLHENLQSTEVSSYMSDHMDFMTVDIGDRDRNIGFASSLGVSIENGIPVAVFFDPNGNPIGATNNGQLEPSRYLTSRQILKFIEAVVNDRQITRPSPS